MFAGGGEDSLAKYVPLLLASIRGSRAGEAGSLGSHCPGLEKNREVPVMLCHGQNFRSSHPLAPSKSALHQGMRINDCHHNNGYHPEFFPGTVARETEGPPEITLTSLLVEQTVRLRAGKGPAWGHM